jgi:hypothetical protein
MSSCCRTIDLYNSGVTRAIDGLQEPTPEAVVDAVDCLRRILGRHQVEPRLASDFRQGLEPELQEVYSGEDLARYCVRLLGFARQVQGSLLRWKRRYCGRS